MSFQYVHPWKSFPLSTMYKMLGHLLDDDQPLLKNGESRKPSGLKNGETGLSGFKSDFHFISGWIWTAAISQPT